MNRLHRMMFGNVWQWVGSFRQRVTKIGVEPTMMTTQLKVALDDVRFWHQQQTFEPDEIAVRLHHRVVSVHPYPNGNGRHSRFLADLYLHQIGRPRLSWGAHLGPSSSIRQQYIAVLQRADQGDYEALRTFANG